MPTATLLFNEVSALSPFGKPRASLPRSPPPQAAVASDPEDASAATTTSTITTNDLPPLLLPRGPTPPPPTYPTALVPPQPTPYEAWNDPRYSLPSLQPSKPIYMQVQDSAPIAPVGKNQTRLQRQNSAATATPQPHQQRQMMQPQMYSAAQQQQQQQQSQFQQQQFNQQQQQPHQSHQQFSQPMDRTQMQHLLSSMASPMDGYQAAVGMAAGGGPLSSYQPQHMHNQPQQSAYYMQHTQQQPQHQQMPQYQQYQLQQPSSSSPYYANNAVAPITVPAFRPSNFNVPFPMYATSGGGSPNMFLSGATPRRAPQVPRRPAIFNPPREGLYEATYAGLPVYETISPNGTGIMRRKVDSWMNATQILKAAGIEKSRRTRVLEREIHQGEHEKIQGGYGKYQGTWIPLWRARELVGEYGLGGVLNNILDIPE
ncbi:hypothetical protein HDU86_002561 [Geranomyces michiganensis]|nr:hypothetical protein HDU86_002561 [Geranomyces michiganensis]